MFLPLNIMNITYFSFFISIVVVVICLKWYSSATSTVHKNLPPSPWKLPIIGNFHQLGLSYHRSFSKLAKKHGPLMLLHLGSVPILVASSADAAREIMKTKDLMFSHRGKSRITRKITYDHKTLASSDYGEYWRQLKSLVVFHLLSNKRVRSFQKVREEEMALVMDMIEEGSGSVVNLSELIFSITTGVVCRVSLGKKYEGKIFMTMIEQLMQLLIVFSVGNYIPWLSWVDTLRGLNTRVEKVAKEFDDFLEGMINDKLHERRKNTTGDKKEETDEAHHFIDILLEQKEDTSTFNIHRDTIKAVILDMFIAGSDTTFTTLEWAFSELVRNPHVLKKLQKEVKLVAQDKPTINEDDLGKLQYLHAVVKETLRLHPPLPLIPRESTHHVNLMGCDVEAGTKVFINLWAIGRDPALWEDPEEFRPERFLNSPIDFRGSHFEYIPFGSGRRGCPGIEFAQTLIWLVIANVVYKFDLSLPAGGVGENLDMTETFGLAVHRKNPLLLVPTLLSEM